MREVLVVAGPSAVGKTTVVHKLLSRDLRYEFVRSLTTRPPRSDAYSSEYIYIERANFEEKIREGKMLEHTEYAGELYGTPLSEIDRICDAGRIPLLILDLAGVETLSNARGISACIVYLYNNVEVLEDRLSKRYFEKGKTPEGTKKFISRREQNASDYANIRRYMSMLYAFLENNGTPDECANKLAEIFNAFTLGAERDEKSIRNIADMLADSMA